jgi:hypothetical protein
MGLNSLDARDSAFFALQSLKIFTVEAGQALQLPT